VAAPLFSTIMQYALHLERVPPTTPMAGEPLTSTTGSTSTVAQAADRPRTTTTATPPSASSTAPVATGPPGIVGRPTS
jgi:hypothetical protein